MKNKKTLLQKCYEKMMIAKNNPSDLTIVLAREFGQPRFVLCYKSDGGDPTPLAILLTVEDINNLEPLLETSLEVEKVINKAMLIDKRKDRDDFETSEDTVNKIFDEYCESYESKESEASFFETLDDETWLEYAEDATNHAINLMVER